MDNDQPYPYSDANIGQVVDEETSHLEKVEDVSVEEAIDQVSHSSAEDECQPHIQQAAVVAAAGDEEENYQSNDRGDDHEKSAVPREESQCPPVIVNPRQPDRLPNEGARLGKGEVRHRPPFKEAIEADSESGNSKIGESIHRPTAYPRRSIPSRTRGGMVKTGLGSNGVGIMETTNGNRLTLRNPGRKTRSYRLLHKLFSLRVAEQGRRPNRSFHR